MTFNRNSEQKSSFTLTPMQEQNTDKYELEIFFT